MFIHLNIIFFINLEFMEKVSNKKINYIFNNILIIFYYFLSKINI